MSAEQTKVISQEQLKARCGELAGKMELTTGQFLDFIESLCLLTGQKPKEDPDYKGRTGYEKRCKQDWEGSPAWKLN